MLNRRTMGHEIIKRLREERDWTLKDVADRLNSYPQQISKYELGHTELTLEWIRRFAKVYGVTAAVIIGEETSHNPFDKYTSVISKLIWEIGTNGKNPSTPIQEHMQNLLNIMISGDIKRGIEIDLERYRLFLQNIPV